MYSIENTDIYEFMKTHISRFDTSNYHLDNPYGMPQVNASVVLKLKDETAGVPIEEWVGLAAERMPFAR